MEPTKAVADRVSQQTSTELNKQNGLSTNTPPRQNLGIAREQINAMMNVLNKRWLSKGWRVMDPDDSEAMAIVWIESLNSSKIPHQQYEELFRRCVDLRSRRLTQGLECDEFSVDMMIACWPSLAKELEEKRIAEGRYLAQTAASDCPRCFGSGMECVPGKGSRPCDHSPMAN